MTTIITIVHLLVCLFLIVIVLLQHGKGADIGATFGGSGQSLFGTEGPMPLMNKITTSAAVIFMFTSISLAYISAHKSTGSVMSDFQAPPPIQRTETVEQGPLSVPMPEEGSGQETAPATFPGQAAE